MRLLSGMSSYRALTLGRSNHKDFLSRSDPSLGTAPIKRNQFHLSVCAALLFWLAGVAPLAHAAYVFTDLGTFGGASSSAVAINNAGQIVGTAASVYVGSNAALWDGTTMTNLTPNIPDAGSVGAAINSKGQVAGTVYVVPGCYRCPGYQFPIMWDGTTTSTRLDGLGFAAAAFAINNMGKVAGWTRTETYYTSAYHATVWDGPTITILTGLGGNSSFAMGINDAGVVVGNSDTGGAVNQTHAAVWLGTTATDLGTLGGSRSEARAINNTGLIAGYAHLSGDVAVHATVWNGTTITDLGTNGIDSWANAINSLGEVVGVSYPYTYGNGQRATLWNGTTATDLNSFLDEDTISSGWVLTSANGINDNGWIVGDAVNSVTGARHGFLLSTDQTVPEPSTIALITLALVGLGLTRRERRGK